MRQLRLRALAVMLGAFCFLASPSYAYDCDTVVVDDAKLFGSEQGKVESAANELIKSGANVRVRTLTDYGDRFSSLDEYKAYIQSTCGSWRSADNGMRNNLIVFMIEKNHRDIGLYYGDQWERAFRNNADATIRSEVMTPRFRDGDFAGGFVAGIKRTEQLIDIQVSPPVSTGPTTIINKEATDTRGITSIFLWLVILGGVGTTAWFGLRFIQSRRAEREEKMHAQQQAQMRKTACANAINNFDTTIAEANVSAIASLASDEDVAKLRRILDSSKKTHAALSAEFTDLESVSGSDPSNTDLTAAAYASIGKTYEKLALKFDNIRDSLQSLESEVEAVKERAKQAPAKIAEAESSIETAKATIATVKGKGFKVDGAERFLNEAVGLLTLAHGKRDDKRLGECAQIATRVSDKATAAIRSAEEQPLIKERLDRDITSTQSGVTTSVERTKSIYVMFERISATYLESLWKPIQGNGTEAENRLEAAQDHLDQAVTFASLTSQDWEKSSKHIREAGLLMEDADKLLNAIVHLSNNLVEAEKKAPTEIASAQADITRAWNYIKAHDADVADSLENDLKRVEATLEEARVALKQEKPDFIRVVKLALKANNEADRIFERAEDEHRTMERKREQAAKLAAEAKRSFDEAERYINIHTIDVRTRARQSLAEARDAFMNLANARSLDQRIAAASRADQLSDAALEQAQSDVAAEEKRIRDEKAAKLARQRALAQAEEDEEEQRRRRRAASSSISFPSTRRSDSWGTPSRSSSGSGGSTSFGGSSGGFGGSSSIGRSSSGRGGSSKW